MNARITNYTSGVDAATTISRIEARLVAAGASGISKTYSPHQQVEALVFTIDLGDRHYSLRVPAKIEPCYEAMWAQYCREHRRPREEAKARIRAQAARTAWRLVEDWVNVQVSLILMRQAEWMEVFLPYVWDGRQTYFEALRAGGFKALTESSSVGAT